MLEGLQPATVANGIFIVLWKIQKIVKTRTSFIN